MSLASGLTAEGLNCLTSLFYFLEAESRTNAQIDTTRLLQSSSWQEGRSIIEGCTKKTRGSWKSTLCKIPWFLVGNEGMRALHVCVYIYMLLYIYIYIYIYIPLRDYVGTKASARAAVRLMMMRVYAEVHSTYKPTSLRMHESFYMTGTLLPHGLVSFHGSCSPGLPESPCHTLRPC